MSADHTQAQSEEELRRAQQMSARHSAPPTEAPGYSVQQQLGVGAFGEVWLGFEKKTGRRVAIKFYAHEQSVNWSNISREVEKLVFLSADRYVVQLLDVGWDAAPPYYVMEYLEHGSLDELITREGSLPVAEAVEIFREVAIGLTRAHGKAVLHCDLKPGNILLDQDRQPRLADFGQARMSNEQKPALGTLFYMAPEQADLQALPDARWDVYALGAVMHAMLTGEPPYRDSDSIAEIASSGALSQRLEKYRQVINTQPPLDLRRKCRGLDRPLAEIIERCLAVNPNERFAGPQQVLEALAERAEARSRRPLMVSLFVAPLLLFLVMAFFGWRGFQEAIRQTDRGLTKQAQESNDWAAQFAAGLVSHEIERYFAAVERVAADPEFRQLVADVEEVAGRTPEFQLLNDPRNNDLQDDVRKEFDALPQRLELQARVEAMMRSADLPRAASWFVCNTQGTHLAAAFDTQPSRTPIGRNFSYRTYFHGGRQDVTLDASQQAPRQHIRQTHLSAAFPSTATDAWKVAVSTPIIKDGQFVGILALTVELGDFMKFEGGATQFAVLVDNRPGAQRGVILQHPLFNEVLKKQEKLPQRFSQYRVDLADLAARHSLLYRDPLGDDKAGAAYAKDWIVAQAPVFQSHDHAGSDGRNEPGKHQHVDSGLVVLVQEDYEAAIAPVHRLSARLIREGVSALLVFLAVVVALWYFVQRMFIGSRSVTKRAALGPHATTSLHKQETLETPPND